MTDSDLNSKLEVRNSPIEGKGLFAREPVGKGERLTSNHPSDSVVMTDEEFEALTKTATSYDAVALGGGKHRVSTVSRDDAPGNYVNHNCDPNAVADERGLVAARNIAAGEEITSDYALVSQKSWSMVCHCGSAHCRRVVRGTI